MPANKFDSSTTTSSITAGGLVQLAPRTSGELLRNLPGIRVEASGGDGNADIFLRADFNVRTVEAFTAARCRRSC